MAKQDNYIMYKGEKYPLADYTTMAMKAKDMDKAEGYVRKIIHRIKHNINQPKAPKIEYLDIVELNLTIVKK